VTVVVDLLRAGHVTVALAAILAIGVAGRTLSRRLRQPGVIGEIALGLVISPALIAATTPAVRDALLPRSVGHVLGLLGQAGLAMYLVGVAHDIDIRGRDVRRRAVGWLAAGAIGPPMLAGCALAGWVVLVGRRDLAGTAPRGALVLLLALALTVTAVPVLARILDDRNLTATRIGSLALTVAVIIDAFAWILLAVAAGLAGGGGGGRGGWAAEQVEQRPQRCGAESLPGLT
jgi:Kef-type K+ transport system membrane component KefB